MLSIKLNGNEYRNFTNASVTRTIEALSGSFQFTSTVSETSSFPVKKGDLVEVMADDVVIMTGYIEKISVTYDASQHTISITGRSTLCDFIDSSISSAHEFTGVTSLVTIIETLLADVGIAGVTVTDMTTEGIESFTDSEVTSASIGEKAFEFVEYYARKRQVLLNDDGTGNIILVRSSGESFSLYLKNTLTETHTNNILSASITMDDTQRYNSYKVVSQLNPSAGKLTLDGVSTSDISNQQGSAIDDDIKRTTRKIIINAEESSDSDTSGNRATWEANYRRSKSLTYAATVQGHSLNGEVFEPNVLVMVEDDFCGIKSPLLVRSVTYNYSVDGGSLTTLDMTYNDAFILQASITNKAKATESVGKGLHL